MSSSCKGAVAGKKNATTSDLRHSCLLTLILLIAPFVEYLFLRLYVRNALNLRIGWGPILTDFDFFLPVPFSFFCFVALHPQASTQKIELQKRFIILNLSLVGAFLVVNHWFSAAHISITGPLFWIWIGWCGVILGTALLVFVPTSFFFNRRNATLLAICTPLAVTTIVGAHCFQSLWKFIVVGIALVLKLLTSVIASNVQCILRGETIYLSHPDLTLVIGQACGGLDGFLLASYTLFLLTLRFGTIIRPLEWAILALIAWITMLTLNSLRIVLILGVGLWMKKHLGSELGLNVMLTLFHSYSGWILYFFGLIQILLMARWVARRNEKVQLEHRTASKLIES